MASLQAITRIGSDHVPLLLASMDERPRPPPRFRFENFWLRQPGFVEAVQTHWVSARAEPHRQMSILDEWHHLSQRSRQFMKGWGANLGRDLRERKKALLTAIQALDLRADTVSLSPDEWLSRYDLDDQLSIIYTDEEAYWRLRGSQKWVLKGDTNTAYFQAIANGRRRRNTIPLLWDGDTLLQDPRDIRSHVDSFYRSLFSAAPRSGVSLAHDC